MALAERKLKIQFKRQIRREALIYSRALVSSLSYRSNDKFEGLVIEIKSNINLIAVLFIIAFSTQKDRHWEPFVGHWETLEVMYLYESDLSNGVQLRPNHYKPAEAH